MNTQAGVPKIDGAPARAMYEQPFEERIRTLLRMEQLFDRARHAASRKGRWDSFHGAGTILEILDLLNRGDLRGEILKETDGLTNALRRLNHHEGVDPKALEQALARLETIRKRLVDGPTPGRSLRDHEFLAMIRQRLAMPGGTCGFDLPRLQAWMELPANRRLADIEAWLEELEPLESGVNGLLELIRESARPVRESAPRGLYRHHFAEASQSCRMVQIFLPQGSGLFPEISGNRQRFTVRFMQLGSLSGPARPIQEDVDFGIALCQL